MKKLGLVISLCFGVCVKAQTSANLLVGIYSYTEKNGYIDSLYLYPDSSYRFASYIPEIKKSESTRGKWTVKKNKLILGGKLPGKCTIVLDASKKVEKLILTHQYGYKRKRMEIAELKK